MTANIFACICIEYTILPELALENESVVEAIKADDEDALRLALYEDC